MGGEFPNSNTCPDRLSGVAQSFRATPSLARIDSSAEAVAAGPRMPRDTCDLAVAQNAGGSGSPREHGIPGPGPLPLASAAVALGRQARPLRDRQGDHLLCRARVDADGAVQVRLGRAEPERDGEALQREPWSAP